MRITSGGNVGIGTSNPTYTLDTYGGEVRFKGSSTYMTVNIDNNSTNGGGGIYLRQNGTIGAGIGLSGWYLGGTSSDLFLNSETGRNIRFAVNAGTEAMRITSGGELLINTTSDAGDYKLQVNGASRFLTGADGIDLGQSTGNSARANVIFRGTNASGTSKIGYIGLNVYSNDGTMDIVATDYIRLRTGGSATTALYLDNNQNAEVGGSIKTAAPSGGTAASWKLGERVASSGLTLNDTQYIQLDIAGTLYTLATVNLP